MIVLYICNIVLLIVATILTYMHFVALKNIHKMMNINEMSINLNNLKNNNELYIRDKDCTIKDVYIHPATQNKNSVLVIDLK